MISTSSPTTEATSKTTFLSLLETREHQSATQCDSRLTCNAQSLSSVYSAHVIKCFSHPSTKQVPTATIDNLNLSTDSVEEEDWAAITQSAIDSHTAKVMSPLRPRNASYSQPCSSGPSSPASCTRDSRTHTADSRSGRIHPG